MKKRIMSIVMIVCFVLFLKFSNNAYAFSTSCSISIDKTSYNPGESVKGTVYINADDSYSLEYWITCSNGQEVHQVEPMCNAGTKSIPYSFNASAEGNNTISVRTRIVSLAVDPNTFSTIEQNPSTSCGFYVITAADKAAAEESRRQQEAYNASVAASQAVESSIAASKYAESSKAQQEIDDSIAAEQASIQESEAAIESSVNASIAESASIEESVIQESLSVEESIEQSSIALAESISESESEVERTKAVQIGKEYYVPFKSGRNKFLFATEEAELGVPEGFEKTDLMVNMQYVWAYRNSEMSAHAYLVYGRYEKDDESAYYFYDETNGVFFPYERLYAEEGELQMPVNFGAVANTTESNKGKGLGNGLIAVLCVVSALLGAGIAVLVFMLLKRNAAEQGIAAVPEDDESFVQDAVNDDIEEFGEEYEFENKGIGLEEEDVFGEKTINVQNNAHNNAPENADTPKNKAVNAAIAEAETETVIGNIKFDMAEESAIPSSGSVIPAETVEAAEASEIEIEELEVLEELSIDRK